jgi:hypothetical protein
MIIDLNTIKYYFLTVDTNGARKKHMIDTFGNYDITEINPILGISVNRSGAIGFSRMIDAGLRRQDRSKPFQPFILLEDDASKYREFPETIEIPDDTDILYIGLSKCSMNKEQWHINNYYQHVTPEIVRITNLLAMHGIMVCSAVGAVAMQRTILENYFNDNSWDICLAQIQAYYNTYALKVPLVYQDAAFGGCQDLTHFSIDNAEDSPIPIEFINTTNLSILMCSNV